MAFAPFVDALRRGWIFVLASSLLLGMIGFVGAVHVKPTYTAKAWVVPALVEKLPPPPERSTGGMAATIFINTRIREYTAAADTEAFAERVVDIYGLPLNPTDLRRRLVFSTPVNHGEKDLKTALIQIEGQAESPVLAADITNATAEELAKAIAQRETPLPIVGRVVDHATVPPEPSEPQVRRITLQSAVLGFIVGMFVVFGLGARERRRVGDGVGRW